VPIHQRVLARLQDAANKPVSLASRILLLFILFLLLLCSIFIGLFVGLESRISHQEPGSIPTVTFTETVSHTSTSTATRSVTRTTTTVTTPTVRPEDLVRSFSCASALPEYSLRSALRLSAFASQLQSLNQLTQGLTHAMISISSRVCFLSLFNAHSLILRPTAGGWSAKHILSDKQRSFSRLSELILENHVRNLTCCSLSTHKILRHSSGPLSWTKSPLIRQIQMVCF
jgi:hypothetical protein